MVHNLRARNICGTSDKFRGIKGNRHFGNNQNLEMPPAQALELLGQSTPLIYTPSESLLGEVLKCSSPLNNTTEQNIAITSTPRRFRFLTSTRIDNAVPRNGSGVFGPRTPNKGVAPTTEANLSSYDRNIFSAVDEAIFFKTYKTAKGLSLYGIRKFLKGFGYDTKKCQNKVRLYVRDCIENGKFVQKSGRGANGSFRLNQYLHKSFIKAHKTGTISSYRIVSSMDVHRKRFKQHDTAMLGRMTTVMEVDDD